MDCRSLRRGPNKPRWGGKEFLQCVVIGGIGAGVLVLAAVGFVLYRKASADFEDEAFYEEQDEFIEEEDEPAEIPEGKPLDEFEDKTISAEPEVIERPGDSLISKLQNPMQILQEEPEVEEEESTKIQKKTMESLWTNMEPNGTRTKLAHGGTEKKVQKTGPSTTNEQRDIFQTRVNQRDEA